MACADGYVFAPLPSVGWITPFNICIPGCPTGFYTLVSGAQTWCEGRIFDWSTKGLTTIVAFKFDADSANANGKSWTYSGSWDYSPADDDDISWTINIYGGNSSSSTTINDPYLTAERGVYFDGHSSFMEMDGDLELPYEFSMWAWVRPLKSGAIYSSSDPSDGVVQESTHWGIRDTSLEFEQKCTSAYWQSEPGLIVMNDWVYVNVRATWWYGNYNGNYVDDNDMGVGYQLGYEGYGTLGFAVNESINVGQFNFDFPIIDHDQFTHRLGALERDDTMVHHFKGFIAEWGVDWEFCNGVDGISGTGSVSGLGNLCNGCAGFCYGANFNDIAITCFSTCDALHYVDGDGVCQPCMTSCTKGCINNSCT